MRKIESTILAAAALLSVQTLSAQERWLFPGFRKAAPDSTVTVPAGVTEETAEAADTTLLAQELEAPADTFVLDIPETISATLLLPLHKGGRVSHEYMEFYAGALLAARDLGNEGRKLVVNAYDTTDGANPVTREALDRSDVIIGPISMSDISRVLQILPDGKSVISPLEPKMAAMAVTAPVIQAPSSSEDQADDLVSWIGSDLCPGDNVVMLCEEGMNLNPAEESVKAGLDSAGIACSIARFSIQDGARVVGHLTQYTAATGTTRFIVATERESFANEAVRNVTLLMNKKHDVAVYATSRIRSFSTVEIGYLHDTSLKMSAAYAIDYSDPEVKRFVLAYRALFNEEPSSFAFQGYDVMHYFCNICAVYGRQWEKMLPAYAEQGLQASFAFTGDCTHLNKAVRRSVYNRDYSISVVTSY